MAPGKKSSDPKAARSGPAKAATPPEQLTINVPPSSAVVVLGIDVNGRLYHHFAGPSCGLVEAAGLMKFGEHVLRMSFEQALVISPNAPPKG